MALRKVVKYAALAVGLVVLAAAAVSALTWLFVSVIWPALVTAAILLAVAAGTYVAVKVALWLYRTRQRESESPTRDERVPRESVDALNERYVKGELSEDELERLLEREFDDDPPDEIDRELDRLQSR